MNNNSQQKILNIINQTIADTNYIKDDYALSLNISKILTKWSTSYIIVTLFLFTIFKIAEINSLLYSNWYFPIQRILTILMYLFTLFYYFYYIYKNIPSLKEKDFLKLYAIVPCILVFVKIIMPLSFYINNNLLLDISDTISLDFIALIISAILLKFYFRDPKLIKFISFNIIIYVSYIIIYSLFISSNIPSPLIIQCYNVMRFLQDIGLIIILHFFIVISYMKKVQKCNEKYS